MRKKIFIVIFITFLLSSCAGNQDDFELVINDSYKFISKPVYDGVLPFTEELMAVRIDNEWGYINRDGEMVIEPRYEDYKGFFGWFSNGYALVKIYGNYTFIDKQGEIAIVPEYDLVFPFYEGLAAVVKDEKVGFIDTEGNEVIKPMFHFNWKVSFSEGLFPVEAYIKETGEVKWGYINKKGDFIIPPLFDYAENFYESYAVINIGGKYGYVNRDGEYLLTDFNEMKRFSEGLSAVKVNSDNVLWGYIGEDLKVAVTPKYEAAGVFSEGLAPVLSTNDDGDKKWGYINKKGEKVIDFIYGSVGNFSEGVAKVKIDGKWGFINYKGEYEIEPQFKDANSFTNAIASVKIENGKWGFIERIY